MRIDKIMTRHVATCGPHDSLEHAASLMWSSDCGCLPVTIGDGARLVDGIITDRDICMAALFQGKSLRELRVQDAMAKDVISCKADSQIDEAERQMQNEQIRRLPVVDADGGLIGIISLADIVRESARMQHGQRHEIPASEITATLAKISTPLERPIAA